jgi:acylpyruvate hydrolase
MKIICITPQENKPSLIYLKPDTALLRNNDAFYMPDFSEDITARLALVIKVKKMGKKIAERFAHRYYEEVSTGINLEARDLIEHNKAHGLPWDEAVAFDYSAPIGRFISPEEELSLSLECSNEKSQTLPINSTLIKQRIVEVSQKFTLKIGDYIYITLPTQGFKLEIGQELTGNLNGENLLKCTIK